MARLPLSWPLIATALWLGAAYAQTPPSPGLPVVPSGNTPPAAAPSLPPVGALTSAPAAASANPPPADTSAAAPAEAVPGEEAPAVSEKKDMFPGLSYGDIENSLLFTPRQIDTMKTVLQSAETAKPGTPSAAITTTPDDLLPFQPAAPKPVEQEPASYPVFYLSSVVYRSGSDWTVWLGSKRITPRTNKGDLQVAAISPDIVTFNWKPAYLPALVKRQEENKFAPIDKVKHRLTSSDNVTFDMGKGIVSFTLRPNQSFAVAYMNTFEGKIVSPTMPAMLPPKTFGDNLDDAGGKVSDAAKAVLNDMGGKPVDASLTPAAEGAGSTANALKGIVKNSESFVVTPHPPSGPPEPTPLPGN